MKPLKLGSRPLKLEEIHDVAVSWRRVELAPTAKLKTEECYSFLHSRIKRGDVLYGVNTGFGLFSEVQIPQKDIETLQRNLIRSHAAGIGHFMPDHYVRAMLLLRVSTLAKGYSGVSMKLINQLLAFLNKGVHPLIPQQGSVGASGDLAPLAHLALVLIGEGRARVKGKEMSGAQALRSVGLKPLRLGAKEGLALINGTQFMTAIGALTLLESEHLCNVADLAGALSLEALRGTDSPFSSEIHEVRPHPGQVFVAKQMRRILNEGGRSDISKSHADCGKVQDPYSLRCIPQVHGATRDTLRFVRDVLEREINSVTDNPLVFKKSGKILNGGNFHGQIVAIAMDALAIAVAELGSISEQRIEKLMNPAFSELPAFLTKQEGLNSGLMIVQVAAASVVSENKTLCHPASVDSIPTSVDKEDHVSMGAWAARKAARVVTNTRRVLTMELFAAAQGIDLLRPLTTSKILEKTHQIIRKVSPRVETDRPFYEDISRLERLILSRELDCVL